MQNLSQPVNPSTSALARIGMYLLVPVVGLLLLPVLLLFIIALYLLALFHGTRVFVFSVRQTSQPVEEEIQKPHFLDIQAKPKFLSDESSPPAKG